MIEFHYQLDFRLDDESRYTDWIKNIVSGESKILEEISYIFVSDKRIEELNREYLTHDYPTDVISFDNSIGGHLWADIYISVEQIRDNAERFGVSFDVELKRVMAHGLLHCLGYDDITERDKEKMREKEDEKIKLFHVEQ